MKCKFKIVLTFLAISTAGALQAESRSLAIYNWTDYIGKTTLADFSIKTGIKPVYDVFDTNDTLEAKLLTGHTGYDVVFPSSHFVSRQIRAGVYEKLDKSQLPNYKNLDGSILKKVEANDPGNSYAIPYMWGTKGIAYNVEKIKSALGVDHIDSWNVLFDPDVIKKLSSCGVALLDAPDEVFNSVLKYQGKNPYSTKISDYEQALILLKKIKPSVTYFHSSKYIADLANGNICIAMAYNGDAVQARDRAVEAGNGIHIAYATPKDGTSLWVDMMAIPSDAKNKSEAYQFINFILDPGTVAKISSEIGYASPNKPARSLVPKEILNDPAIYPTEEVVEASFMNEELPQKTMRWITRAWSNLKGGQ
ncbi:polyamine ABC transporter substrate-binding protein [Pseudomonas aeruginosa]|uniref:polyamine ABC transporter substrate-binding protein n=1 Tax=Pseudomonas aeruginosa TaxID=287 RepID=UPI0015E2E849|nr:polyamine ABC transporter substrate-binding protein [Pseudomonas aeruginosa]MBA1286551.1 polyamine ABC transporter substrate-binding protein [Pseudomonas aeruginosa]